MNRASNNSTTKNRHKKIIKLAKGYKSSLSKLFVSANQTVLKALKYSYKGRKNRKRNYINLWIKRINIACKLENNTYAVFIQKIKKKKVLLNKKIIAKLCIHDPKMIKDLIKI